MIEVRRTSAHRVLCLKRAQEIIARGYLNRQQKPFCTIGHSDARWNFKNSNATLYYTIIQLAIKPQWIWPIKFEADSQTACAQSNRQTDKSLMDSCNYHYSATLLFAHCQITIERDEIKILITCMSVLYICMNVHIISPFPSSIKSPICSCYS